MGSLRRTKRWLAREAAGAPYWLIIGAAVGLPTFLAYCWLARG